MAERPILPLPTPTPGTRTKAKPSFGGRIHTPTRDEQAQRVGPKFQRLQNALNRTSDPLTLQDDPSGLAPERALVFETAGDIASLQGALRRAGLEYLSSDEEELDPDQHFYNPDSPEKKISGRLYIAMPDQRGLREMLSMWRRYQRGDTFPRGSGAWGRLFDNLHEIRPWGPKDRILKETIEAVREHASESPDLPISVELELWYRATSNAREASERKVRSLISELGGSVLHVSAIREIHYHGLLVRLPPAFVDDVLNGEESQLSFADEVMIIRPQTVSQADPAPESREFDEGRPASPEHSNALTALFDGVPVQNHRLLANHVRVDDPDDMEDVTPVPIRHHGTAMASLIIHGDLEKYEASINHPLYVRPLLREGPGGTERTPDDQLLIDIVHRAVKRIKEGEPGLDPVAPDVIIINISLGDRGRPFSGQISPWARLLDYLSFRYGVVFFVSAGNVTRPLHLPGIDTWSAYEDMSPEDREEITFKAMDAVKHDRTLLSPAESLNSLTVGSLHRDNVASRYIPAMASDPFVRVGAPNVTSAVGLGYRRVLKPDFLLDGGREMVQPFSSQPGEVYVRHRPSANLYGLRAAATSASNPDSAQALVAGTSAATALASHYSSRILEGLIDDGDGPLAGMEAPLQAVALKALMVHGCQWHPFGRHLDESSSPRGPGAYNARRENIGRVLGYGAGDHVRALECAKQRATLIGADWVKKDQSRTFRIPLPGGLESVRGFRAVTITLAWLSPVNVDLQRYRAAILDFGPGSDPEYSLKVSRESAQPTSGGARRGTVAHERRTGEQAAAYVDEGMLVITVSCRAATSRLDEFIPFALAISIEVGTDLDIDIYQEVRDQIRPQIRPGVSR